ncbi:MAG TPA: hypothetical protein VFC01_08975 [Mycobacterium sp.]|nr:hypothetical protein [Mycobacterium sp.]
MRKEEAVHGTVKDDDLDLLVSLDRCDDFIELRNTFWPKDIQRWQIERNSSVRR